MKDAVETIKDFGFGDVAAQLIVDAFSARETALKRLTNAKTSDELINGLGDFAQTMIRAAIHATLDPAIQADVLAERRGKESGIGDYEVISGAVSPFLFELSYMVSMMAEDKEMASNSMHGILDACLEEADKVVTELKKIQALDDDGNRNGNEKPVVYN